MAPTASRNKVKNEDNIMGRILVKKDKLVVLCRKISFKTVIGHHKTYQVEDIYKRESLRCRIMSPENKSPSACPSKDVLIRIKQRIGSAKRKTRSDLWTPANGGVRYSVFPKQNKIPVSENPVESITLLESQENSGNAIDSMVSSWEDKENMGHRTYIISKKDDEDLPLDGNLIPIIRAILDFDGKFDPEHRSSDVEEDVEDDSSGGGASHQIGTNKRKYVDIYDLRFRRASLNESNFYSSSSSFIRDRLSSSSSLSNPKKRSLSPYGLKYDVFQ